MLTSVGVTAMLLLAPWVQGFSTMACSADTLRAGLCGAENNGSELTISVTQQQSRRDAESPGAGPEQRREVPVPPLICQAGAAMATVCREVVFPPAESTPAQVRQVTMSDLARFAPEALSLTAEPGGVGVAGVPTNFVAAASSQTRAGSVLGVAVNIRFTPIAYEYSYGDGTSASITTPGRTWSDLGQAQFTPTPTSHVYKLRGVYFAEVDVRYTAEVDLGGGWTPVTGEVRTEGPPQRIRVLEARTALVAHNCTERRDAPGC